MKLMDILSSPLAIHPRRLMGLSFILDAHHQGGKLDLKEMEKKILSFQPDRAGKKSYEVINGAAIIPIQGVISKDSSAFSRIFYGGASTRDITRSLEEAAGDSDVSKIILHIDSPGGTVDGTREAARAIFACRGSKEIIAFSDGLMASAAYWMGSAADKVIISGETVEVGSIGVISTHVEYSEMDKRMGVAVTEITAGKYKAAGSPNKPMEDMEKEYLQGQVNYLYTIFVNDVAAFRGETPETVLSEMADGKIFIGTQAIEAGLVDGVSTFDELINISGKDSRITASSEGRGAAAVKETVRTDAKEAESMKLTAEELKEQNPDLYRAVFDLGKAEASTGLTEEQQAEAEKKGAETERARIQAVKAQLIPGHEALIEKAMFDGETTGEKAALLIVQAEKSKREEKLHDLEEDGKDVRVTTPEPGDGSSSAADQRPVEEKAKAEWEKSATVRAEFGNDFDVYLAYLKNEENVRIKRG